MFGDVAWQRRREWRKNPPSSSRYSRGICNAVNVKNNLLRNFLGALPSSPPSARGRRVSCVVKYCARSLLGLLPRVVVRRVGHLACAYPRGAVAGPVGVGAVVETLEILAVFPVVPGGTHAPRHWELDGAPAVEGAIVLTVLRCVGVGMFFS